MYSAVQREVWDIEDGVLLLDDEVYAGCTGEVEYEHELTRGGIVRQKSVCGELTFKTREFGFQVVPDVDWFQDNKYGCPREFSPIVCDDQRVVRLYGLLAASDPDEVGKVEFVAMDATEFEVA